MLRYLQLSNLKKNLNNQEKIIVVVDVIFIGKINQKHYSSMSEKLEKYLKWTISQNW